ncbi:CBO0543 family protein [Salipaludibacillus sp. CF4.18]|uniref:CBO0543 family protein n=1 Tax=Salipaludibacillus sp. CF4.18 TaxID=3373081 RepID=UPI003EE4705B
MTIQKNILRIVLVLGFLQLPFAFKREKLKDWLLVFFLKGYISSFIASVVVKNKNITFPIRFMPKYFDISVVFDYLLFPLLCVFFNRTTLTSKPTQCFFQSLCYSLPMTIIEIILERYTDLINYKKNWNWIITYSTLVITFLSVRVFMSLIRKLNIEKEETGISSKG